MQRDEAAGFPKSVFVNCPFDKDHDSLLKALLYTVSTLGFMPRIATERADSGEQRVQKICELIAECKYSIHDLSRIAASEAGEFYRLNMPFELGVDYGSRRFGASPFDAKRFIILASTRYDYMRALSDLNGVDIEAHGDDPRTLIRKIRNWLCTAAAVANGPSPSAIWYDYADFSAALYTRLKAQQFSDEDIHELPVVEYLEYVHRWLTARDQ